MSLNPYGTTLQEVSRERPEVLWAPSMRKENWRFRVAFG